jgi:taurine dioxygenase
MVWAERQLLLFRGQKISPDRQIAVMELFGNVLDEKQDGLNYQYVSGEETAIKPSRLLFHSDTHYTQVPLELLSLYGERIGDLAVPTLFSDGIAAYARLSPEARDRLEQLESIQRSFFHLGHSDKPARDLPPEWTGGPVSRHPAIWRHPETDAPFVYLSEMHSFRLDGVSEGESYALLDQAFAALYDPEFTYEHKWREDDFIIWNNRTVQHARGPLPAESAGRGDMARSIRRVGVGPLSFSDQFEFTPEFIAALENG